MIEGLKIELWDWVVNKDGEVIQIDSDDMHGLPYNKIARFASNKEIEKAKSTYHYRVFNYETNDWEVPKKDIANLAPVYEVIAGYPNNNDFPIGKIIEFKSWNGSYWQHSVEDCQGKRTWLSEYFDNYPHLFKKIK